MKRKERDNAFTGKILRVSVDVKPSAPRSKRRPTPASARQR
jgi:hypothetical protein